MRDVAFLSQGISCDKPSPFYRAGWKRMAKGNHCRAPELPGQAGDRQVKSFREVQGHHWRFLASRPLSASCCSELGMLLSQHWISWWINPNPHQPWLREHKPELLSSRGKRLSPLPSPLGLFSWENYSSALAMLQIFRPWSLRALLLGCSPLTPSELAQREKDPGCGQTCFYHHKSWHHAAWVMSHQIK